jgi:hypothetical protein
VVVAALADADDEVARTAAAIVRHEWRELPAAFFEQLDGRPAAAHAFLRELAIAPRPAAAAWARSRAKAAPLRADDERCLALAAIGGELGADEALVLWQTFAAGTHGEGFRAALDVLPAAVVDRQIGRLHAALLAGAIDVDAAGAWLDRLSVDGTRRLLGLVVSLPPTIARPLCLRVRERLPAVVAERVAAQIDADGPIDAVWLAFAGPVLDRPSRIAKVDAVLADAAQPAATRDAAALALLDGKVVTPTLLAHVAAAGREPLAMRLLGSNIDALPAPTLAAWLTGPFANATARALPRRRGLEPELEAAVLARLAATGVASGEAGQPLAMAIVQSGSARALERVWPLLRESGAWPEFLDHLARRGEPFVHQYLLREMETAVEVGAQQRTAQLDAVALALLARGDAGQLPRLVAAAANASAAFVRRCAHHGRPLPAELALRLLDAAPTARTVDVGAEMVGWAATAIGDERVGARLAALWQRAPATLEEGELRDVALRALAASPQRPALVAQLRAAFAAGPVPPELENLPFAVLASIAEPPAADDLTLAAELVLALPRRDPNRDAEARTLAADGGRFPLVAAVAERLRAAPPAPVGAAFAAAAVDALADPRHRALAPQRFLTLWRELQRAPDLQRAVGIATAPLALAIGGGHEEAAGPCHWFALQAALDRGDFAAAADHATRAGRGMLRLPEQRRLARTFLGERDPGAGVDPWAALAAAPHLCAWRAATAAGDAEAARRAAAAVREFAGRDVSTFATVAASAVETVR